MATDISARQLASLKDLAQRVDSPEVLPGFLSLAMRMLVAEGDFGACAVSLVGEADMCETVAAAGPTEMKKALVGTRFPVQSYLSELAAAESWGPLRFVAIEHSASIGVLHPDREAAIAAIQGTASIVGTLYAPLHADSGRLLGMISIEITDEAPAGILAQRVTADIAAVVANVLEAQLAPQDRELPPPEPTGLGAAETTRHAAPNEAVPDPDLALRDAATGLPNREGLVAAFEATLERLRQDGSTAAVLYLVLEEFDAIAETLGSDVSEEVLRRVSKRLQDSVRTYDVVARVALDTMAIVADHIAPHDTNSMVSRLRRTLAKVHIVNDEVIRVRGTVGLVLVDHETPDTESAIARAQDACEAERSGVNSTYVLYSRYSRATASTATVLR